MAPSDESLIAGIASGDTYAMTAFVRRYQTRVYGLALRVTEDSGLAEEAAQDAFVRAWRYATTYDARRGRVGTWLLTIARNVSVDAARMRRDCPIDPERLIGALVSASDEHDHEWAEYLRDGLRALPAEQEGVPLGTAKTRIRRGLARLRHALVPSGD